MYLKIKNKLIFLAVLFILIPVYLFGFSHFTANLKEYDKVSFERLEKILEMDLNPVEANVMVFDNIKEFCSYTGAPYWIKGFTNLSGIYIQSKSLLNNEYKKTVLHELLHWTIKNNCSLPQWYEEGLVCIVTGETENIKSIKPMENPEGFTTVNAENDWDLLSYELGCVKKVKKIIGEVEY